MHHDPESSRQLVSSLGFLRYCGYFENTFSTALFKRDEHQKIVQSLLGHASIVQTVDTYSHLLEDIGGDAVGTLNGAFG